MGPRHYSCTNNSHITISDNWLRTSAVIHMYKARARRNGYRMLFQLTFCADMLSKSFGSKLAVFDFSGIQTDMYVAV